MTARQHRDAGGRTDAEREADLDRTVTRYIEDRRLAQGESAARGARQRAAYLTRLVRDEGPDGIGAYLDALTGDQLYAVIVTLAAAVPADVPLSRLLAWVDNLEDGVA